MKYNILVYIYEKRDKIGTNASESLILTYQYEFYLSLIINYSSYRKETFG